MAVRPEQLLVYAGGEALSRFGTFLKRTSRRDEVIETHTRSSAARAKNRAGTLVPWESDVPRAHWVTDENGLTVPSYLLEGARTNELTRSEALDHADWTKANTSVTADQATGPDGETSLDEIVEDGTTGNHRVEQALTGLTANANYAHSCFAIAGARNWLILTMRETAAPANGVRAWFNLSTGAVGTTQAVGTGAFQRGYVEDWTDIVPGLYRCVVVGSIGNGATANTASIRITDADGSTSHAGDGSSSLFAGYAQLEDDADFASSYIPTTNSSDSRTADSMRFAFSAAPQEMTVYLRFREGGTVVGADFGGLFHIGDASGTSGDPRFHVRKDSAGDVYQVLHDNGTTTVRAALAATPSIGDIVEIRAVLHADGHVTLGQSINGGAETTAGVGTTATLGAEWAGQRLYLNSLGAGNTGFNAFIGLKVALGEHSLAAMQAAL